MKAKFVVSVLAAWVGCWAIPAPSQERPQSPAGPLPEGVEVERDLEYARPGGKALRLDLYRPRKADHALPVIVWVHGGAWSGGDKSNCPAVRMATRGYAVASVGYRLSGEAIFPAQIEDCKAAIRWLRARAKQNNLDADRFGAWGSSAGGHLVALLGTSGQMKDFDKGENLECPSRVQAVCDFFGPTDFLQMGAHALPGSRLKHDFPGSPESRLIGGPIQQNPEKVARANPITYVRKGNPPFLIMHGDKDPVVPFHQSQILYDTLKKAGVEVQLHPVQGAGHGFGGRAINDMVDAFFDKHLRRTP